MKRSIPAAERLWAGAKRVGDCLIWQGTTNEQGYGQIREGSYRKGTAKVHRTHRLAYKLTKGPIPDGLDVCHTCDTPSCIEPEHLFAGTRKANMEDCVNKERQVRGERNGRHKLTEAQVIEIRLTAASGASRRVMSETFGVTQSCIDLIVWRKRWAHVS